MTFTATYFGSSGWLIKFGDFHLLIDPWFTGNLSFPPGPWLIEGKLPNEIKAPDRIDLILLTQGLADHAHPPTLKNLSKSIPVIGSSSAAKVVEDLGFQKIYTLQPGMTEQLEELTIEACAGAPVPNIENGYVINHPSGSLYVEPHGFLDPKVKSRKLDAVITPVVNITLPLVGAFVKGKEVVPDLVERFQPLTFLASTTGGNAKFSGLLGNLMKMEGSIEESANLLSKDILLLNPIPGESYSLRRHRQ